ncbi:MAG: phage integrase SAM-like domain-containing protein [Fodinibius sp.]|nr:phage integrase SAM-like domain-containing protein [Fodinibius sp.]
MYPHHKSIKTVIEEFEQEGKHSTAANYDNLQSKLEEYTDSEKLSYEEINSYLVEDFSIG